MYRDFEDKSSLISVLTLAEADKLLASGVIGGGMLPKLQNCIDAVREGVSRVHIMDGRIDHSGIQDAAPGRHYLPGLLPGHDGACKEAGRKTGA